MSLTLLPVPPEWEVDGNWQDFTATSWRFYCVKRIEGREREYLKCFGSVGLLSFNFRSTSPILKSLWVNQQVSKNTTFCTIAHLSRARSVRTRPTPRDARERVKKNLHEILLITIINWKELSGIRIPLLRFITSCLHSITKHTKKELVG